MKASFSFYEVNSTCDLFFYCVVHFLVLVLVFIIIISMSAFLMVTKESLLSDIYVMEAGGFFFFFLFATCSICTYVRIYCLLTTCPKMGRERKGREEKGQLLLFIFVVQLVKYRQK